MKDCFIVVTRSYSEGLDAYAFFSEEEARRSVEGDVGIAAKNLLEAGYIPTIKRQDNDNVSVYVAGDDIYYEWSIVFSQIR